MGRFDPKNFRKPKDSRLSALVERSGEMPLLIEARKPDKEWFVRTRKDEKFQALLPLLSVRENSREAVYFLDRNLEIPPGLEVHVHDYQAIAAVSFEMIHFLWVMKVSDTEWYYSAVEAMNCAREKWVKVFPNDGNSAYEIQEPVDDLGEPTWPEATLEVYFERAFNKRLIDSLDHKIVKRLLGRLTNHDRGSD